MIWSRLSRVAGVLVYPIVMAGCLTLPTAPPPTWIEVTPETEREYEGFLRGGAATLVGQAFLTQQGGGVVRAAGRSVTLDPATSRADEWWGKAGKVWLLRDHLPPSPNFLKARKTTVADADGRFVFRNLAPGTYYVRTEVTWEIGGYNPLQGGIVSSRVVVVEGANEVVLNQMPR